jgi:RNA polymerase nonessential primary-like sigma factor
MNIDHESQRADSGYRLGSWVVPQGSPGDRRVLEGYLREMGVTARLRPEEETLLAKQIRNSRKALYTIYASLSEPWRGRVLASYEVAETSMHVSSREGLEGAHESLLELARENPCQELSDAAAQARRCKRQYDRVRDKMIVANLRLVVRVAGKFRNRGIPLLDLIQEGNLGLIRAVEKFEVDKGYRFSTYAIWWIRHGLSKAFSESLRLIRLPAHVGLAIRRLRKRRRELEKTLGRTPTTDEIARDAGVSRSRVVELLAASRTPLSLDEPGPDDDAPIHSKLLADGDQPNPLQHLDDRDRHDTLMTLMMQLSDRERMIVKLRLGIECDAPHTLARIATILDLSRERIRQIEQRALLKLRQAHNSLNEPSVSSALH